MVPVDLLFEHVKALLVVWGIVLLAGIPSCAILRVRLGFPGFVLLGMVYWAVSLFVFCFDGGLTLALALALAGFLATMVRRWRRPGRRSWPRGNRWAAATLAVGCGAYTTLLLWNYLPLGMDTTMVGTSARMISMHRGLPSNYAPWFEELFFPTVNQGLPTLGSVAINMACEPGSVVLGLALLSYSAWILAAYVLLRLWARPATAAVLAVAQAWGARWAQNTIGWGGFTTVAGMAVGLFAVRLMWEVYRRNDVRSAIALGTTTAAILLIHGISAAVWFYAVVPVAGLTLLILSHHRARTLIHLLYAAGVSGLVILCYLLAGQFHVSQAEIDWTYDYLRADAPKFASWLEIAPQCLNYLKRYGGDVMAWLGLASLAALVGLGRWRIAFALTACLTLLLVILANGQWCILPVSMLLYPDRAVYWGGPLAAVTLALAWRVARKQFPRLGDVRLGLAAGLALIVVTFDSHVRQYQRIVAHPTIGKDGWEALRWARTGLTAPGTLVQATYGSVGWFLPACAGVPTMGLHIQQCAMDELRELLEHLRPTHRIYVRGVDPTPLPPGSIVFQNATVTIVELTPLADSRPPSGPQ
jgi:hypothetical protein